MKDIFIQFREQSDNIRVDPQPHTWPRIQSRLQSHRSHRRLATSRFLMLAAGMLLVIALSVSLFFYSKWNQVQHTVRYSASIEKLAVPVSQDESIFDIASIRKSYSDLSSR